MNEGSAAVLVAVPARDEADDIVACLDAVAASLRRARHLGVVAWTGIAVASHRSFDNTREVAAKALEQYDGIETLVVEDDASETVGEVRHRVILAADSRWQLRQRPRRTWIFSTDADSLVPADWVTGVLGIADHSGADVIAGMVDLHRPPADAGLLSRYEELVAAGMRSDGHGHVYAANLAIRLATYLECGGFPSVEHGEEHGLLAAARRVDAVIATPLSPRVRTSARMPGRAQHGFGALLHQLRSTSETEDPAETA
jgi:hypothetical protein